MKNKGFDYEDFAGVVSVATRSLDNIIDISAFPTEDFRRNTLKLRPIGLGFTGLAEAMFHLGIPYNSEEGYEFAAGIARVMTQSSIKASIELAGEKGNFEVFEENKEALIAVVRNYFDSEDEKNDIENRIRKTGIRNSNWTTLAPTGTISLILDACTYSLEPQFALAYNKNLIDGGTLLYADPEFEKAIHNDKNTLQKVVENGEAVRQSKVFPKTLKRYSLQLMIYLF